MLKDQSLNFYTLNWLSAIEIKLLIVKQVFSKQYCMSLSFFETLHYVYAHSLLVTTTIFVFFSILKLMELVWLIITAHFTRVDF